LRGSRPKRRMRSTMFGVWWLCPPSPALAGNACRSAGTSDNKLLTIKYD